MEFLTQYGLAGLFTASFLAATILPMGSEVVLGLLIAGGQDPGLCLAAATSGNVLGAVVNYLMGFWGGRFAMEKIFSTPAPVLDRAIRRFKRYGTAALLFAWVPVVGDPLTVAAGVLKVNFTLFLVLVTTGKALRYLAIALALTAPFK